MKEKLEALKLFNEKYGIQYADTIVHKLPYTKAKLRFKLMEEENEEYLDAVIAEDPIEVADALGDMLYILCGTILAHGMQDIIDDVFNEIQRSNLSKLGPDGKPIYREDGKLLKGPNYSPPNLKQFITE